jgi:hypothetical protein
LPAEAFFHSYKASAGTMQRCPGVNASRKPTGFRYNAKQTARRPKKASVNRAVKAVIQEF